MTEVQTCALRSTLPPLADGHSPRPESGVFAGSLGPGETVVLTPPDPPGADETAEHGRADRASRDYRLARLGGTGKTQLAATLGHAFWAAETVDLLVRG